MIREITCICCPLGCRLQVEEEHPERVSGNSCPRGAEYAKNECTHPTRVLTTTVKVVDGKRPLVSVKSAGAIPKELLFEAMKTINCLSVPAPVELGQVLLTDLCGSGIPLVATGSVEMTED